MHHSALPQLEAHLSSLGEVPGETRRLFHGRGRQWEGLEQVTIDWLDGQLLVCIFKQPTDEFLAALKAQIAHWPSWPVWDGKLKSILLQHRYQSGSPMEVLFGEFEPKPIITENGLKFSLDLGQKQNSGLFLDMRLGRKWVLEQAKNKRVLNLFSYTCGFSVAAMAGGAQSVVNLDMAKAALSKGRDNHRLNDLPLDNVQFMGHDILKSWGKIRKNGPYDLVIIDPPSFQKGSFALTKDYKKILRRLPEFLSDDAQVLACVNAPDLTSQFLIDEMAQEAPEVVFERRLDNPPEFNDIDEQASLKSLLFSYHPA